MGCACSRQTPNASAELVTVDQREVGWGAVRWALVVVQVLCDSDAREWAGRIRSTMTRKRRRHTPDQIIRKLAEGHKQLAAGTSLEDVCRHLEVAESTWHRWLAQYGGMK